MEIDGFEMEQKDSIPFTEKQYVRTLLENRPEHEERIYAIYQNDDLIGYMDLVELVKSYGNFRLTHHNRKSFLENEEKCVEIDILPPEVRWYHSEEEIECVGFTDTSPMISDDMEIDGFYTYCIGNSFEARYIYIDIAFHFNPEVDKEPQISILNSKSGFEGYGFRDVPIRIPQKILDMVLRMTMEKKSDFFG